MKQSRRWRGARLRGLDAGRCAAHRGDDVDLATRNARPQRHGV